MPFASQQERLAYQKAWVEKNKEEVRRKRREWYWKNHEACRAYSREYYAQNKERCREVNKEYRLKGLYGLSVQRYKDMVAKQHGRCLICCRKAKLVIDHCHKTGKVRGLLCSHCNLGIGSLKDNPHLLKRAAEYVVKARKKKGIVKMFPVPDWLLTYP